MKLAWLVALVACGSHDKLAATDTSDPATRSADPSLPTDAAVHSPCTVSVLIDAGGLWIGTSAGTCHAARTAAKELDFAWVEAELAKLVGAYGRNCSVEGELVSDSGTYQELIGLMDAAIKVGIVNVGIAERRDLQIKLAPGSTAPAHCKAPPAAPRVSTPPTPLRPEDLRDQPRKWPTVSDSGEIVSIPLEIQTPLPVIDTKTSLQNAPVIVVTRTEITLAGQLVTRVESVPLDDSSTIKRLFELLEATAKKIEQDLPKELAKACADAKRKIPPVPGRVCPTGLVILQADASTDVRLIHVIVRTAKAAGFDNLLFAVKNRT